MLFLKLVKSYLKNINSERKKYYYVHSQGLIATCIFNDIKPKKIELNKKDLYRIRTFDLYKNLINVRTIYSKKLNLKKNEMICEIYNDNLYTIVFKKFDIKSNYKLLVERSYFAKISKKNLKLLYFIFSLPKTGTISFEKTLMNNNILVARSHHFNKLTRLSKIAERGIIIAKIQLFRLKQFIKKKNIILFTIIRNENDRLISLFFQAKIYHINNITYSKLKNNLIMFLNSPKLNNYSKLFNGIKNILKMKNILNFEKKLNSKEIFHNSIYHHYDFKKVNIYFVNFNKLDKFISYIQNLYNLKKKIIYENITENKKYSYFYKKIKKDFKNNYNDNIKIGNKTINKMYNNFFF